MLKLVLGDYGHARIWIDDLPADALTGPGEMVLKLLATDRSSTVGRKAVALEVAWHVGGMIRYGMLGAEWRPEEEGLYSLCLPVGSAGGRKWAGSIATKYDDVRIGVIEEYAAHVTEGLTEGAVKLGRGNLSVTHAAHGLVGSSRSMFLQLGRALVRLLCLKSLEADKMREVVVSSLGSPA